MKYPITPRGLEKLKTELKSHKSERPAVADAIETARAHGDISENADYDAAKEKSGMLEAKIRDLEARISNAQVIDPSKLSNPEKVINTVLLSIDNQDSIREKIREKLPEIRGLAENNFVFKS